MSDEAATAPQRLASDPLVSAWVGANAGSGKTRVLTQRVARLLLAGADPGRILCLTYTKAAAAEMQSRLFDLLGEWSMQPDETLAKMLGDLSGEPPVDQPERLAVARRLFARALETPGGLKIQTIHAFCDALLRRFPLEAGVAPSFEVIDDRQSALLLGQIRDQLAQAAEGGSDYAFDLVAARLNEAAIDELIQAVLSRRSEFSIQDAEALIRRHLGECTRSSAVDLIREHLEQLIAEAQVVARVFSSGSTSDQKTGRAVAGALEQLQVDPVSGAEKMMAAVLVKTGPRRGLPLDKKPTKSVRQANPGIEDRFLVLAEAAMTIKDALARQRLAERTRDLHIFAKRLLDAYASAKEKRSLLDFDDLIRRVRALLNRSEMRAWVLYKLDRGIDHVLVDEAQDTAPAQWDVIAAITDDFHAGDAGRETTDGLARSVFVVGDEKQSIYSFQGAEPWSFGEMRTRYETRIANIKGRLERPGLITSFRSAPGILSFVDAVFAGEAAKGVTFSSEAITHRAYRSGDPSRVDLWPIVEPEPAPERPHWTNPVDTPSPDDPKRRLARLLAQEIARMVREERLPKRGSVRDRPVRPGDILVLVRKRDDLAKGLIENLKALGVPVAGADRLTLAEELAVKDILSLIRAVLNRDDELALAEVLRSPLCGVSEQALFDLAHSRKGKLWHEVMVSEDHAHEAAMLSDLANRAGFLPPYEFLERLLTHHDGRRRLIARLGVEAEDPIDEILAQAIAYEGRETPSLHGFLAWIEAGDIALKREMDKGAGEVRIMTIHGAKGLEAPIVILPDTMSERRGGRQTILPTPRGSEDRLILWPGPAAEDDRIAAAGRAEVAEREAAEAKRLLYVGLTRAEDWLILCGAGQAASSSGRWYGILEAAFDRIGSDQRQQSLHLGAEIRRIEEGAWPRGSTSAPERPSESPSGAPSWFAMARREARPRRLTPSHLSAGALAPETLGVLDPAAARQRGDAVHLLLERLPDAAPEAWSHLAPLLLEQEVPGLATKLRDEAIAEAFAVLGSADLSWVFGPGSVGEVGISLPLDLSQTPSMQGRIDRLIVTKSQVTIVDFKSDQLVPDRPSEVSDAYLSQLGAYQSAVSEIYSQKVVQTALLWTRVPRLMRIDDKAVDTAFTRALAGIDLRTAAS
ncbi:MAG: double-strand break repair helicase AddA [Pseudomonadota bacterium]